ncbi:MAG TPA: hypothetical protein VHB21_17405 [Minicystis sp.]|nr:hypothetical protein [Minicystis sp.]
MHTPVDAACDDGVFCTRDRCDPAHGCRHPHDDTLCDDGIDCTIDTCVTATDACRHDACDNRCDDGVFCNGVERCDTAIGCVAGPPACRIPGCGPGTCHENGQTCTVMPSCAPGPTLVVTDSTGALVSVALDGQHSVIAPSHGDVHFDIAIVDGRWFAIDPTPALVELKPNTNHVKNSWPAPDANSLGAGPDGMLYAANSHVFRIDPDSGAFSQIASLPPGYSSSGDIAFLGSRMFVSADGPCGGALVEVLPDGTSQVIGGDGLGCVYGLASTGSTLYVMNCDGKLGTFDPDTGEARVISTPNLSVYGADILP